MIILVFALLILATVYVMGYVFIFSMATLYLVSLGLFKIIVVVARKLAKAWTIAPTGKRLPLTDKE